MDLSTWFNWIFASPGYFLLVLVGLFVLVGLICGVTDSRTFDRTDDPSLREDESPSGKPWWKRDEEQHREWAANQIVDQHRCAKNGFR